MPPASSSEQRPANGYPEQTAYPSRNIAYTAAGMITSIVETLNANDELRFAPAFIVYSLFSALIMHVYQMRSSNLSVVSASHQRLGVCMNALKEVSKVWLVAKMVHTLFESILGNKVLEERLQKAAGKRHAKSTQKAVPKTRDPPPESEAQKRKFDDMELGFSNGPPAPQVSYERSRPQSPAMSPGRELPPPSSQHQQLPQISSNSPQLRQGHDAFMGTSRTNTRPTTPFNYSYPGTPPDLFLYTRNSPNISQDLWQNFQPNQLFPADTNGAFHLTSPTQGNAMVDPQLQNHQPSHTQPLQQYAAPHANMQGHAMHHQELPSMHVQGQHGMPSMQHSQQYQHDPNDPHGWAQMKAMNSHNHQQQQQRQEDTWSNSSTGPGPMVPTTLNVGDWFEFFGITNGDVNGLNDRF
ncbi:Transcriptional activator of fatty acid utilization [Elasticomyces elasticus]|nr:Transcriptional activator of fatty acid utilization [Elasticomyces elasticus]